MGTILIALAVWGSGTLARWYLHRTSRRPVECLKGWLRFTVLWNRQGAFDAPIQARRVAAVSALLLPFLLKYRKDSPLGTGLVLGGGLSNLWERLRYGRVYDYLQCPKAPKRIRTYVYNLADLVIFAGTATLFLRQLFKRDRRRKP